MSYTFTDRKTKKKYSEYKLAILFYKRGQHIVYSDLEGVAIIIDYNDEKQYYLLDECGHYVWINPERFIISESL